MPSYKLKKDQLVYIDKKDQAPSYCDRVLYKNNSNLALEILSYECFHDVYGSDHRPVALGFALKDFGHPHYYDLRQLHKSKQGYGQLDLSFINLENLDLLAVLGLQDKIDLSLTTEDIFLRFSFYDSSLDTDYSPIVYSTEKCISALNLR